MASKTVPYCRAPTNPRTPPEAPESSIKHPKTSKVKMLPGPLPKDQDSLRSLVKQSNTGPGLQPKTCYCLNLCPLPAGQLLAPESPIPSAIPEATGICLPEDGMIMLQLMDQIRAFRKNLRLAMFPPAKPPYEVARKPKGRTQHRSKKKRDKEVLGFSINLVLSDSDLSAPDIPEYLPIPEATAVTIPAVQ
ncbi:Hypothetical predicted protein [Marmota monax]|uniref:Uncharacterized protein n=1 Tax=Marmota monax TaxID=9995 RepID=A0A5E4A4G4_MARMO|nr:Hypothetical predicted protein [Marmota monax]